MAIKTTKVRRVRHYYDEAEPSVRYPSVTGIIDMLPKPWLQYWAAGMTAELAVDSLAILSDMAERDRAGAIAYLRGASSRYTKQRAGIGSEAHDLFERMIRGQAVGRVHPDMEPYRRGFAQFLEEVQPELVRAEDVAWSDTHRYAGSFDAILRIRLGDDGKHNPAGDEHTVIVDWKTSASLHSEVALQISAYAHAEYVISPDGTRSMMPACEAGAALHITPDGWEFVPVEIGSEVFDHFVSLRHTFDWTRSVSDNVLGDPIALSPQAFVTGTERRG